MLREAVMMQEMHNLEAREVDAVLLSERVTNSIRDLILSGRLEPGSRIGQEQLAEQFGTSRIPVREALKRLESEGLVSLVPNSGAWVAKLDLNECIEIYKIRERLEPLALSESLARMTGEEIDELARLAGRIEKAADTEEFLRLDRQFHLASYRAANMQVLNGMVERFWNTTQHYRRAFTNLIGADSWVIHAEHSLMIDAMKRRDCEGAAHVLFEHIRRTRFELERNKEIFNPPEPAGPRRKRRRG
jgi:DNA-binding GntR family transcriptional regulator